MKNYVLVYDPHADDDPVVYPFGSDEDAAFEKLAAETIAHLGEAGIEVVLFRAESFDALKRLNLRYFNPDASRRLREDVEALHRRAEQLTRNLGEMVSSAGR
ncbi:MAG: hypothetical protein OXN86_02910 [Chloroflexota bacterium]|nr:hypothetical protein [Chloroflexota bacterium]